MKDSKINLFLIPMQSEKIILPLDIYYEQLTQINGVEFTTREVDVISCLLNRRATSISGFLLVGPRAVETYIRNIRQKAGGLAGREQIIDFIEKSDKFSLIKNEYYFSLRPRVLFEEKLNAISKKENIKSSTCLLVYEKGKKYKPSLIPYLKEHLKRIGFEVRTCPSEEDGFFTQPSEIINHQQINHVLYIFPDNLSETQISQINASHLSNVIFLFHQNATAEEVYKKLENSNYINMLEKENYYLSFFEILKKLLPHSNFESLVEEFKQQYEFINESFEVTTPQEDFKVQEEPPCPPTNKNFLKERKWYSLIGFIAVISALSIGFFIRNEVMVAPSIPQQSSSAIRSELILPNETTSLNRPEIIGQIDNKFKGQGGIQSVALVGIGGAGKTTLARQYAHEQNANVVWEINAETKGSLNGSFENLAQSLAKTGEDQKTLRGVREIKDSTERKEKILHFVKEHLKLQQPWFLIYDNVENLSDIQKYFPHDNNAWGEGKIILTTRNNNIQNNSQISGSIFVEELNPNQKLTLFMQIMNHGEEPKLTVSQKVEMVDFLKKVPPFPLDISVAAYYLKTMNITYGQYLEYLNNQDKNFSTIQENLLKEAGAYEKTRYNIITLSLEKLIAADKNFAELLLFISILDSQNIPRDLLDLYKGKTVVDNFIYYLKKYSLVVNPLSDSTALLSHLSIHRSTQDISFSYLKNYLKLNKDSQSLKAIAYAIDDYSDQALEQEDFPKMRLVASHLEKFLIHCDLLTDFSKGLLQSKLGSIYYFINDDNSKKILRSSLHILEQQNFEQLSSPDITRSARSFLHIGAIYTELRFDTEAQDAFEKAVYLYEKEESKNNAALSWVLSHLGNIHRKLGNYDKAKYYLEESACLHKQYGTSNKRIARTLAYLGGTYRGLVGFHQKAIESLEESLAIYNKNFPNDDFRLGWVLMHLGNLYRDLGDYKKAKQHLEHSLHIFKKHLPNNHISIGVTLGYLGNCFRELGEYGKSCDYLEQSLKIHQKHLDENHLRMGWILFHLASTYKSLGNDHEAHQLYDKVLKIYVKHSDEENIKTTHLSRDMKESLLREMAEICIAKNSLDDAESFIKSSLKILQHRNYVDEYRSLEVLGDIYLKRSLQPAYANTQEVRNLKIKATDAFQQALKIIDLCFPKGSVHYERIKNKISNIKKYKI